MLYLPFPGTSLEASGVSPGGRGGIRQLVQPRPMGRTLDSKSEASSGTASLCAWPSSAPSLGMRWGLALVGIFFFFSFYGHTCGCWPTPQPQQHQIQAASVTYTAAFSDIGSLTHQVSPGIKPTSLWTLCWVLNRLSHNRNSWWGSLMSTPSRLMVWAAGPRWAGRYRIVPSPGFLQVRKGQSHLQPVGQNQTQLGTPRKLSGACSKVERRLQTG